MAVLTSDEAFAKLGTYLQQIECSKEVIDDVLSRADNAGIEELGLDSRDILMLAFFVEEDFNIPVDIEQIVGATTVLDIVLYMQRCALARQKENSGDDL